MGALLMLKAYLLIIMEIVPASYNLFPLFLCMLWIQDTF